MSLKDIAEDPQTGIIKARRMGLARSNSLSAKSEKTSDWTNEKGLKIEEFERRKSMDELERQGTRYNEEITKSESSRKDTRTTITMSERGTNIEEKNGQEKQDEIKQDPS